MLLPCLCCYLHPLPAASGRSVKPRWPSSWACKPRRLQHLLAWLTVLHCLATSLWLLLQNTDGSSSSPFVFWLSEWVNNLPHILCQSNILWKDSWNNTHTLHFINLSLLHNQIICTYPALAQANSIFLKKSTLGYSALYFPGCLLRPKLQREGTRHLCSLFAQSMEVRGKPSRVHMQMVR